MSNEIDNYNRVVDFIGNIIKVTSDSDDQESVDKALDIAHIVGDALETVTNNNNTGSGHDNGSK